MVLIESVSVSNVSKRPIVRCLQRFKNAILGLDYFSHLLTLSAPHHPFLVHYILSALAYPPASSKLFSIFTLSCIIT